MGSLFHPSEVGFGTDLSELGTVNVAQNIIVIGYTRFGFLCERSKLTTSGEAISHQIPPTRLWCSICDLP